MKKQSIVLASFAIVLLLTGCGGNGTTVSSTSQSAPQAAVSSGSDSPQQQESTGELTLEEVLSAPETDAAMFSWRMTEDGAYLNSYSGNDDIIVIPEEVEGKPVLGIDVNGLNYLDCRAVVMPDSLQRLEQGSLGIMGNLEILVYGTGLQDGLTMPCADMSSVRIIYVKEGAKHIPDYIAIGAQNMEKIYFPESLEDFGDTFLIVDCGDPILVVPAGSAAEQYAIDNGYKYENP